MTAYTCPKCRGTMRPIREWKQGVMTELERCCLCGAMLLDDGEFERLVALEIDFRTKAQKGKP